MIHTCVNEDVPLQMVVGSECSIAVNTDVALGVLQPQRSIIIVNAENLRHQKEKQACSHVVVYFKSNSCQLCEILTHIQLCPPATRSNTYRNCHTLAGERCFLFFFLGLIDRSFTFLSFHTWASASDIFSSCLMLNWNKERRQIISRKAV